MTSIGRYETVRELHHSGFTVLYSGRTKADSDAKFAIKVFQPPANLLEAEKVKAESDLFLNSAHVQQKTAASGAEHWAPIQCALEPLDICQAYHQITWYPLLTAPVDHLVVPSSSERNDQLLQFQYSPCHTWHPW